MQKENPVSKFRPADRLQTIGEYYFSRKLKEVAVLNAAGKDIISLGVGSPDMPPSEPTIDALCATAAAPDTHGYQPYNGIPALRQAIADWYARWYGVSLDPNTELLPLMGSKQGILHVTLAFANVGDRALVPNPGYPTYTSLSRLLGVEPLYYNLTEATDWQPDFDELEHMDLSGVRLMWCNYPHMPTGAAATSRTYERLVDFAHRKGIIVVNDNPYSFILNDSPRSLLAVDGARDCCIELNSLSKSHCMPGWRIGMLASNAAFTACVQTVASNIESGMFRGLQEAAVVALHADADWYARNNAAYAVRRTIAEDIMRALGCTFDPRQSGMFLWGKIPDHYADVEQLTERVLHEARVFLTPGFIFGSNGARYIRISLCCPPERLHESLSRIKSIL
jgi:aspartate/methionine/tyrosine aminotransferase